MSRAKVGVFDSGVGGLSVAQAIEAALPDHEVIFVNDSQHLPYGNKLPDELLGYVVPILQDLQDRGCQAIVIACNTISTTLIGQLRKILKVPLVGMEPMVKPAAQLSRTKVIAICATPTTLASQRYRWLKETYAPEVTVLEPDCSSWSSMIEAGQVDQQHIKDIVEDICRQSADVIVLGCTHYHWIEELITTLARGRAKVLQPEQPVIEQLKRVLS